MIYEETEYFRRREHQERAAAKNAKSVAARRVHQKMAEYYAGILNGLVRMNPVNSLRNCGAL
jgi:hypothetical protein